MWTTFRQTGERRANPASSRAQQATGATTDPGRTSRTEGRGHLEPRLLENGMQEPSARKPVDRFRRSARQTRTNCRSTGQFRDASGTGEVAAAERFAEAAKEERQPSCSKFLYWIKAARLRRAARAGGQGPPPLLVSATAAPAPTRSARSNAEADSRTRKQRDHSEHQGQADTGQERRRRPTSHAPQPNRPHRRKQSPAVRPLPLHRSGRDEGEAVTNGRSVAETGRWLLEAHVTGARSTHPPPWLTFGGSGQDPSPTRQRRNGVDVAPVFEHANYPGTIGTGFLTGIPRPDHPECCPG